MTHGLFVLVVGPSGAGKDTLIDGARADPVCASRFHFARRVITRPAGAPGEAHDAVDEATFAEREAAGGFLMTWRAHGLSYGLPMALRDRLEAGEHVLANGSRAVVAALAQRVPHLVVVEVRAASDVLAQRIAARGRESHDEVLRRVSRKSEPLPATVPVIRVYNDGTPEAGVADFVAVLNGLWPALCVRPLPMHGAGTCLMRYRAAGATQPSHEVLAEVMWAGPKGCERVVAPVWHTADAQCVAPGELGMDAGTLARMGVPAGASVVARELPPARERCLITQKVRGQPLSARQYDRLLREVVEGRHSVADLTAFLVAATQSLTHDEVAHLAQARAALAQTIAWDEPMVVDKHSIGGVPGSRITLVVVPIVAAFGLAMPKTSSRAITSAAGTADAMETLARVDLSPADVQACVRDARACIAWNGRLNHSVIDDVMNAITRPLGLDSARWAVASILSKKKAAGATHVMVDLPWGPGTKLADEAAAAELAQLFERTGQALGLKVCALTTRGDQPIGRGVGPALEVRDVRAVLNDDPAAPRDLRDKALLFAAHILAWDPRVGTLEAGRAVAQELLVSGAAHRALERIIDAQGRRANPVLPGNETRDVCAKHDGVVTGIDGWSIAEVARAAGAPADLSAGVDVLCPVGQHVKAGEAVLRIHASTAQGADAGRRAVEAVWAARPAIRMGSDEECLEG